MTTTKNNQGFCGDEVIETSMVEFQKNSRNN